MSGRPREFNDTAVIDAAMEVFWEKGYEACSTEDLCQRTGLGRGSLYNAFGNKQTLYGRVLQRYYELGIQGQLQILDEPGTAKERLRRLLASAVEADLRCSERKGCMGVNSAMEMASKDQTVSQLLHRHVVRLEQAVCHTIALGQRAGEISSKRPPLELARIVLACFYGLRVLAKAVDDCSMLSDIIDGTLDSL